MATRGKNLHRQNRKNPHTFGFLIICQVTLHIGNAITYTPRPNKHPWFHIALTPPSPSLKHKPDDGTLWRLHHLLDPNGRISEPKSNIKKSTVTCLRWMTILHAIRVFCQAAGRVTNQDFVRGSCSLSASSSMSALGK